MFQTLDLGDALTIVGLVFTGGVLYHKISTFENKLRDLTEGHTSQEYRIVALDKDVAVMKEKQANQEGWLSKIDKRVEEILRLLRNNNETKGD